MGRKRKRSKSSDIEDFCDPERQLHREILYDYLYEGGAKYFNEIRAKREAAEPRVEDPSRKALREYLYSDKMLNEIVVIMPKHDKGNIENYNKQ